MRIRSAIVPITNIGSTLSFPVILLGVLFAWEPLVLFGIGLFSLVAVFQLVTLPVEFNASGRALAVLEGEHLLDGEELKGAQKVLSLIHISLKTWSTARRSRRREGRRARTKSFSPQSSRRPTTSCPPPVSDTHRV